MANPEKSKDELIAELKDLELKNKQLKDEIEQLKKALNKNKIAFHEKDEVYKTLFETSHDALFIMYEEVFIDCNDKAKTMFECTKDDLIGKSPLDFSPEFQANKVLSRKAALEKIELARNGYSQNFEWIHKKLNGDVFPAEVSLFRIFINNKPYLQAIVRDLSHEKEILEELRIKDLVFNASLSGESIADKEGRLTFVNQSFINIWGYNNAFEVVGKPISEFILNSEVSEEIIKNLNQKGVWIGEFEGLKKDGSVFKASSQATILKDKNNKIIGYQSAVIDITQKKLIEEAFKKSEEKYRMIIEFAPDAFFHGVQAGNFLTINKAAEELTGFTKDELMSMNMKDLFDPESLVRDPLRYDILNQGVVKKKERLLIHKNGVKIPVEMYSKKMPDETYQSFIRDITQRKLAEQSLFESEQKYRNMVDILPSGVIIHQKGKIVFANQTAANILKIKNPNEIIGCDVLGFVHPDYKELALKRIAASLKNNTSQETVEEVFITPDNESIFVNVTATPISFNTIKSMLVVFNDTTELKKSELQYKESEDRKRALLNAIPDLMIVLNPEGYFLDYHSNEKPYYTPPDKFLGRHISEIFHNEITTMTNKHLQMLFESGKLQVYKYNLQVNDEICHYECRLVKHGEDKALAIIRDITQQINAETALKNSEENFRSMWNMMRLITDNTKDFLWAKDMDNNYIFTNKTICERLLIAESTEEPIGKSDLFFANRERESHPENPEWHTFGEICANTDTIIHQEKTSRQFDEYGNVQGKFLFLDVNKSPIWDNNGKMIGVVGTGRDVTKEKELEKKEAEAIEALMESENRYRSVVANTPIISFVLNKDGIFTLSEGKGLIKLGLKPGQVVGLSVYDVYKDFPAILDSIRLCFSGKTIRSEIEVEATVFDVVYTPLFNEEGNVIKVIGLANDITERKIFENTISEKNIAYEKQNIELKKAKEKAEESDRLKSSFLANLSHEIRTPMNAILGFTDLLKKSEFTSDRRDNFISIIHKSGNYLLSIINDIVEISKIDAGQVNINNKKFNLNSMFDDLYHSIQVTIDKNIELIFKKPEIPVSFNILSDEIKLRQILSNLINNAVKFTEKGSVTFGYEILDKKNIHFFVEDTGIGIDKKFHTIIFERFRQVEGDMAIKKGGSGLGLAISKAYVELLGGKLSFTSEPDRGSTFKFYIPVEFEKIPELDFEEVQPRNELIKPDLPNLILIVEDDDINYFYFVELFAETEFKLVRAVNGKDAVEQVMDNPDIDIVLMDLKLPVMDGYEAFAKIRQLKPELPVIAQTSYALNEDVIKIRNAGFDDYISKPIMMNKLVDAINKCLMKQKKN